MWLFLTFAWWTGFRWGIHYAWRHHGAVIEGAAGMTIAAGWHFIPFQSNIQWIPFDCIVQFALDPYWLPIDSMPIAAGCYFIPFHLNSNFQVVVNWYWPCNVFPMGPIWILLHSIWFHWSHYWIDFDQFPFYCSTETCRCSAEQGIKNLKPPLIHFIIMYISSLKIPDLSYRWSVLCCAEGTLTPSFTKKLSTKLTLIQNLRAWNKD